MHTSTTNMFILLSVYLSTQMIYHSLNFFPYILRYDIGKNKVILGYQIYNVIKTKTYLSIKFWRRIAWQTLLNNCLNKILSLFVTSRALKI